MGEGELEDLQMRYGGSGEYKNLLLLLEMETLTLNMSPAA